jgi:hypothetical protein
MLRIFRECRYSTNDQELPDRPLDRCFEGLARLAVAILQRMASNTGAIVAGWEFNYDLQREERSEHARGMSHSR